MGNRIWLSDFEYSDGAFLVKKTGHRVPARLSLISDFATWFSFYTVTQAWRTWRRLTGHKRPTIAFYPDAPRPWYFIWPVVHAAGAKLVKDTSEADIVFHFDDSTLVNNEVPPAREDAVLVNFDCHDISKSRVASAFETAAGYDLKVDPTAHKGLMVEKSEINAAHDGRILTGPASPAPGKTYQRLVNNEIDGGLVEDLRCCIVGGEPTIVFRKRRPVARRFLNENTQIVLDTPRNCYTQDEIHVISAFVREIGLDWGGVDVLRDRDTGKIFIVDANKTDMGPPIALRLGLKLRSTRQMARAFLEKFAPRKK